MSIFSKIFGKSDSSQLIDKLDGIIDKLPSNTQLSTDTFDNLAAKTIKDVINYSDDTKEKEKTQSQIEQLFNGITVPKERINRYSVYDELYKSVPLIKRIFSVYTANVFQKDTITNKILFVREKSKIKDDAEIDKCKKITKLIIEYYNLDEKLKHFVGHNCFKYGDVFVEVLDLDQVNVKFPVINRQVNSESQKIKNPIQTITETRELINTNRSDEHIIDLMYEGIKSKNKYKQKISLDNIDEISSLFIEFNDQVEYLQNEETSNSSILENSGYESDQEIDLNKFKRIAVRYHKPHKIIPLISPYGNILGYIELKQLEKSMSTNTLQRFLEIVEKISSITGEGNKQSEEVLMGKFVDYTVKKVLEKYKIVKTDKQSFTDYEQSIKDTLKDDLFYALKQVYLSTHQDNLFRHKLSIRFIEKENIFWFKCPSSEYYPYGQSLIDPLVVPGKLIMFTQLANAVIKLSRASLIRKWTVELGSREDSSALLQKLKKSFKNQRVTASDLGTTKDIANLLSDFKDLVTFTKRGQQFVKYNTY